MIPYLIQRAEFEINNSQKGLNSILRFDYMGSSEFEWGALPNSLKRIREKLNEYTYFNYSFKGHPDKTVTIFCKKDQVNDIPQILELLAHKNRLVNLKERCDLRDWVRPEDCFSPYNRNSHWWDIEHDWMFWKKNDEFETNFKEKIKG